MPGDAPPPLPPPGRVVRSTAGRDRGTMYVVVGHEGDRYLLVADGRTRPARRPKKKNRRHVELVGWHDARYDGHFTRGRPPADEVLREMLSACQAGEGGTTSDGAQ
ncbi:MAG: KOW domain-containing RNA-binding protein [Clostridia bacterium]|nr:KOW domain-containing RNA-binding protein [Clostridia bacterium]